MNSRLCFPFKTHLFLTFVSRKGLEVAVGTQTVVSRYRAVGLLEWARVLGCQKGCAGQEVKCQDSGVVSEDAEPT